MRCSGGGGGSGGGGQHVGQVEVGVAYRQHTTHKRVYQPPLKPLLQVVQHVGLVHVPAQIVTKIQ